MTSGESAVEPYVAQEVREMPRRMAHAMHALIESSREANMPVTAAEAMLYDEEAVGPRATGNALARARQRGLATLAGHYWIPTNAALDLRSSFENRYLADTGRAGDE